MTALSLKENHLTFRERTPINLVNHNLPTTFSGSNKPIIISLARVARGQSQQSVHYS
jgi:hypothetical protein